MAAVHLPVTELYSGFPNGGYDLGYSPHAVTGINYGGKHFLFLRQGGEYDGDALVHVLKSTDLGATWTDVTSFNAGSIPSVAICQDGNLAYIFYTDTFGGTSHCSALSVRSYDMSTDTLSSVITTGPAPEKLWHGGSYIANARVGIPVALRSPGDMLMLYPSAPSGGENRLSMVTFNGSAFGTPIAIPGASGDFFVATDAFTDSDGYWHAIVDQTTSTGARSLLHFAVDPGGTAGSSQTVVSGLPPASGGLGPTIECSRMCEFDAGSGGKIAFAEGTSGQIYYADIGSSTPSWSSVSFAPSPDPQYTCTIGWAVGLALIGTPDKLTVCWTVFGSSPTWDVLDKLGKIYMSQTSFPSMTGWSSPTVIMSDDNFAASTVMAYQGSDGVGIFGGFVQAGASERGETSYWYGFTGGAAPSDEYFNEFD